MGPADIDPKEEASREGATSPHAPLQTEAIFRAHAAAVLRWAQLMGGPAVDAEEVLQEVFLVVHAKLGTYVESCRITTWLYGITANVVRDRRRKARSRRWLAGSADEVAGNLPAPDQSALAQIESVQAVRRVYEILDQMDERQRNLLILFEIEGRSGQEIAELLGAKAETVFVWLHRARAEFLRRLEKLERREAR